MKSGVISMVVLLVSGIAALILMGPRMSPMFSTLGGSVGGSGAPIYSGSASTPQSVASTGTVASAGSTQPSTSDAGRMIVRTASLRLMVDDVSTASARTQAIATSSGGFVVSSQQRDEGGTSGASVAIRVPASQLVGLRKLSIWIGVFIPLWLPLGVLSWYLWRRRDRPMLDSSSAAV